MEIFYWKDIEKAFQQSNKKKLSETTINIQSFFQKPSALSIGAFDGPHLGHDSLFDSVLAKKNDGFLTGLVSFIQSPKTKERKQFFGEISSLSLRLSYFQEKNFDFIILIDFSPKFSTMDGKDFLSILFFVSSTKFLAIGPDFRCGYRGSTGISEIQSLTKEQGIELKVLDEFLVSGHSTRSTKIREAIRKGDFEQAELLLGRPYQIDISAFDKKKKRIKDLEAITWRIPNEEIQQVLPPLGRYQVDLLYIDGSIDYAFCFCETHFLRLEFYELKKTALVAISFGYTKGKLILRSK